MTASIKAIYSVFKLRIGFAIAISALAGLAVTPGPALPAWKIAVLALAVLGSAAAAGAFNQFVERDLDARMMRTRNRPFVTGIFHAGPLWLFGIAVLLLVSIAAAAIALNLTAALHVFLGAFVYGIVYTVWLKRRSRLNIVVGGLAGSFAVLAGAAAVSPSLAPAPVILAIVMFLWTPPHFWSLSMALRDDYAKAGVPMLPVIVGNATASWAILGHTVALVVLSLLPVYYGLGWFYLLCAAAGGLWFVYRSVALVLQPTAKAAMSNFHASLLQLSLLLLGALADPWFNG